MNPESVKAVARTSRLMKNRKRKRSAKATPVAEEAVVAAVVAETPASVEAVADGTAELSPAAVEALIAEPAGDVAAQSSNVADEVIAETSSRSFDEAAGASFSEASAEPVVEGAAGTF